ncbi:DUF4249 domain-containing protein [Subsaxibacter sp. CAU 1640]|uniref:DUF4249 domain-containing protein n=1 Tax=Subsaxibacter sp. CAU 1640 TaxID=2933271 RepID=UPI0020061D2B|nr:DUF4249 domain-containing protein [Subsaxibacter sp. CAU 1640]MCK7589957.1 DUF4249 domain-containing protein [Subsaxibacter sp. CAU 1640]
MEVFKIKNLVLIVLAVFLFSCTEEYEIKTENFESLLVVEATLTDELKVQEIKLSKTYRLESDEPTEVNNAQVVIETDEGIEYSFSQANPGVYRSNEVFAAQAGINYTLRVTLSDGAIYTSTQEVLPPLSEIESLSTSFEMIDGKQGIQVYVNGNNGGSDATYFKYDYEETYKIVVPYYSGLDLILTNVSGNGTSYELELVPKPEDVKTCYSTKKSTDIIQTSLIDSQNNSVTQFPVRFIDVEDSTIRERYSILVRQNVQSVEAYNFYKILKELGTIDNIFANNQPGFIQGNITSISNAEENVIGFFQVTSVSTKRIFFDYSDFGIQQPQYFFDCNFQEDVDYNDNTGLDGDRNDFNFIYTILTNGSYSYFDGQFPIYTFVGVQCGDCTSFSSTAIPEFWED